MRFVKITSLRCTISFVLFAYAACGSAALECAVPAPPEHGTMGTCPSSLQNGTTCQPSCDAGYAPVGATACSQTGAFTEASCAATDERKTEVLIQMTQNLFNSTEFDVSFNVTDEIDNQRLIDATFHGSLAKHQIIDNLLELHQRKRSASNSTTLTDLSFYVHRQDGSSGRVLEATLDQTGKSYSETQSRVSGVNGTLQFESLILSTDELISIPKHGTNFHAIRCLGSESTLIVGANSTHVSFEACHATRRSHAVSVTMLQSGGRNSCDGFQLNTNLIDHTCALGSCANTAIPYHVSFAHCSDAITNVVQYNNVWYATLDNLEPSGYIEAPYKCLATYTAMPGGYYFSEDNTDSRKIIESYTWNEPYLTIFPNTQYYTNYYKKYDSNGELVGEHIPSVSIAGDQAVLANGWGYRVASTRCPSSILIQCNGIRTSESGTCRPDCKEGYVPSGEVYCNNDGLDASQFKCVSERCDASSAPEHGTVGDCPAVLPSGSSCQPSCDAGYTVSGPSTCSSGTFSAAVCNANPCTFAADGAAPEHGTVGDCPASLASGSSCQPSCDAGYSASGPSTCSLGTVSAAVCNVNPCDASAAPEHGSVGDCPASLASGSSCQPSCDAGYTVSGPSTCNPGSLSAAVCRADPCDASAAPEHGSVGDCPASLASGSSCQPSCDAGYTVSGPSTCSMGTLSAAVCRADSCDVPAAPEHGSVGDCPTSLSSGSACQPTCDAGYTASGPLTCLDGQLTDVTCSPAPCDASSPPSNGNSGNCPSVLASGSRCSPSCDAGYTVHGMSECSLGHLSSATCRPDPCDASVPPLHGGVGDCPPSLPSNSTCQIVCDDGYGATGRTACMLGVLIAATCDPNPCDASSPPSHGNSGNCSSTLQSGQVCDPRCDGGYTALGNTRCLAGSLSTAQCVPDACDGMTAPTNGTIGNCTYRMPSGTSCQPTCNAGYVATGPSECRAGNLSKTRCDPQEAGSSGSILWIVLGTVGSAVLCVAVTIYGIYLALRSLRERELQCRADDLQLVI